MVQIGLFALIVRRLRRLLHLDCTTIH